MTLYHGSLEIVEKPQILQANRPLDFGTGFYTTTSLQQARRWVKLRMEQSHFFCARHNIIIVVPLNVFFIACRTWKIISQYHITIIYKQ